MIQMPTIKIQCYSGYKADERPVSFILHDKELMVEKVIDQWRGPEFEYFKVLADDGKGYMLTSNHQHGEKNMGRGSALRAIPRGPKDVS
jgi:hypothetical protein